MTATTYASLQRPALMCLCGVLVLGCGRERDRAVDRTTTVVVAYCCGDEALNPAHDMDAKLLVFEPLTTYDSTGRQVGRLAWRWEPSSDYREWTYYLRTDVRWHDGEPFTAHDVAFTIELMRTYEDPDYGAGAFESVTVHDDSTVTIRSGHGRRLYQTWMVFYPKHVLQDLDPSQLIEWDFWAKPVGNGAFRFVRLEPETAMEFEANPDFYLGAPQIQRVILKFSEDAGVTELLSGAVDAVSAEPADIAKVARDERFGVHVGGGETGFWALYWNHTMSFFSDARVRRALTLAIDRRELLRVLNLPDGLPLADGPFTPDQWRRRELPDPIPFDPDRARALLGEAGWRDTDGDGTLDKTGSEFRFTTLVRTFSDEGLTGLGTAAVFVQAALDRIGVTMELQALDAAVINERFSAGDFEAVLSWIRFYETPWLERFRFGEGEPIGYHSSHVVNLIDRARLTWIPQREDELYAELMDTFRSDQPVTLLYPLVGLNIVHRRVRGLSSPWRVEPVAHMDELWVDDRNRESGVGSR